MFLVVLELLVVGGLMGVRVGVGRVVLVVMCFLCVWCVSGL